MYKNHEIGKFGEDIATKFLLKKGYYIYDKNFRCKLGEIDIIAIDNIDKNELVFIEVKTRTQAAFDTPASSIDKNKIKHIRKTAEYFLTKNNLKDTFIRFDVIEIYKKFDKLHLNHIKNAIL